MRDGVLMRRYWNDCVFVKTVLIDCSILQKKLGQVLGHGLVRRVSASREWVQEALRSVEESDEHFATGEC
jgi:hypothetical protein